MTWKPINSAHSIDTLSVVFAFGEPVSSLMFRKMMRELERTTNAFGLNIQRPIQAIDINVEGSAPQIRQFNANGMVYQKNSLMRDSSGVVSSRLVEQLQFQQHVLHYTTWKYTDWSTALETVRNLMMTALEIGLGAVTLAAIRLEYIDRFVTDRAGSETKPIGVINKDTDLVSRHVFNAPDLWHSHTGKFKLSHDGMKRLLQVNVDLQDIATPQEYSGMRGMSVLTGVEDRFDAPGLAIEDKIDEVLCQRLTDLHAEAIDLIKAILDPAMAKEVGLE